MTVFNHGSPAQNLDTAFAQQSVEQRAFHQSEAHGEVALKRIESTLQGKAAIANITLQGQAFGLDEKKTKAVLDIIGLTHDAIYHIDGSINSKAKTAY